MCFNINIFFLKKNFKVGKFADFLNNRTYVLKLLLLLLHDHLAIDELINVDEHVSRV